MNRIYASLATHHLTAADRLEDDDDEAWEDENSDPGAPQLG